MPVWRRTPRRRSAGTRRTTPRRRATRWRTGPARSGRRSRCRRRPGRSARRRAAPAPSVGRPRVRDDEDREGEQDQVSDRIRQRNHIAEPAVPAAVDGAAQRRHPGEDEQRPGHEAPVEQRPPPGSAVQGSRRPERQTNHREYGEQQKAEVGERRKRRLPAKQQLVVRPRSLTRSPAAGSCGEKCPGPSSSGCRPPRATGPTPADGGGDRRRKQLADIVDRTADVGSARRQSHQDEKHGHRDQHPAGEEHTDSWPTKTLPHDGTYRREALVA